MAHYDIQRHLLLTAVTVRTPDRDHTVNTPIAEDELDECPTPEEMKTWLRRHPDYDVACLRKHKEAGFDFNATFEYDETFLGLAAEWCAFSVVKFLVEECKANVSQRSGVWYPMHHAVSSKDKTKIEYLLSKGASLNVFAPDGHGCGLSALNSPEFLSYLCEKGLDVRGCRHNYDGETLAMHALEHGDTGCLEVLHEYGAHIEHYYIEDENMINHMDCKRDQDLLMRCLFERIAHGEDLQLANVYPWERIRHSLLRQAVSWVYGRHILFDMFPSKDVAKRIGSYLFFPHRRILEFLAREVGVPPCPDYCYIREVIEEGY